MTTEEEATPKPSGGDSADLRYVHVDLEYRHPHSIPDAVEYPSDDNLRVKIEEYLLPGLRRISIYFKQPKLVVLNAITFKGIRSELDLPENLEADDIERAVLSICYRHVQQTKARMSFLVRFYRKLGRGVRDGKQEASFELSPRDDVIVYAEHHPGPHSVPGDRQAQWTAQANRWEDAAARGLPLTGPPNGFQDVYSPFGGQQARQGSWRDHYAPGAAAASFDGDEQARRDYEQALAQRRGRLFSGDMRSQFHPERMSPEAHREYSGSVLPFALLNDSMSLVFQAFAASHDMLASAGHEQARLHGRQMAQMMDREQLMMQLPLAMMKMESDRKGYQSEMLRETQQMYIDGLRMRGETGARELGYERDRLERQFEINRLQQQLQEALDKQNNVETSTFRRELISGLGPMMLQGVGLFLDHFGKQKLGQAARAGSAMASALLGNAVPGASGPAGAGPSAPSAAAPDPARPTAPRIPRRVVRARDVASDEEIRTQPVRSLCRMVDQSFSDDDRARLQQIATPTEWSQLEHALRAGTDQECLQGLASFMFSILQNEERKKALLAALTPGQNELLEKIGSFLNGTATALDPEYAVQVRPDGGRLQTVLSTRVADAPQPSTIPVPPPDLEDPAPIADEDLPRPTLVPAVERLPVPTDELVPTASAPSTAAAAATVSPSQDPEGEDARARLLAIQARMDELEQRHAEREAALVAEIERLQRRRSTHAEQASASNGGDEQTEPPDPPPPETPIRRKRAPRRATNPT